MRILYVFILVRYRKYKLYSFSVLIMDMGHEFNDEEQNPEICPGAVFDHYKIFLEYIYSLKPSLLKTQLSDLLYPLYVYSFLYLLDKNETPEYAQKFLEKFHFVALAKPKAIAQPKAIEVLRRCSTSEAVVSHIYFKHYRKGIHIKYTQNNYDHLQKWLFEVNQPFLISRLLKENFHHEILNEKLGKTDPILPALQKKPHDYDGFPRGSKINRNCKSDQNDHCQESRDDNYEKPVEVSDKNDCFELLEDEAKGSDWFADTKTLIGEDLNTSPNLVKETSNVPVLEDINKRSDQLESHKTVSDKDNLDDNTKHSAISEIIEACEPESSLKCKDSQKSVVETTCSEGSSFTLNKDKLLFNYKASKFNLKEHTRTLDSAKQHSSLHSSKYQTKTLSEDSRINTQGAYLGANKTNFSKSKFNTAKYIYTYFLKSAKQHSSKVSPNKQHSVTKLEDASFTLNSEEMLHKNKISNAELILAKSIYTLTLNSMKQQSQLPPSNEQSTTLSVTSSSSIPSTSLSSRLLSFKGNHKFSKFKSKKTFKNLTLDCGRKRSSTTTIQESVASFTAETCKLQSVNKDSSSKSESFPAFNSSKLWSHLLSSNNFVNVSTDSCSSKTKNTASDTSDFIIPSESDSDTDSGTPDPIIPSENDSDTASGTQDPIILSESDSDNLTASNKQEKAEIVKEIEVSSDYAKLKSLEDIKFYKKEHCSLSDETNGNDKLKELITKYKTQARELPIRTTAVSPIRTLNIECEQDLLFSAISPNLSYMACGFKNSLYLWKPSENTSKKFISLTTKNMDLCKGNAFVSENERINGVLALSPESPWSLNCLAINPVNNTFMLGSGNIIESWCPVKSKCLSSYNCHTGPVFNICLQSNSSDFVSSSEDKRAILWDFENCIPKRIYLHDDAVKLATFHPKCPYLITATSREMYMWTEQSNRRQGVMKDHKADITAIAFSLTGDHLASCDKNGRVYIWDMKTRKSFHSFLVSKKGVGNMSYNFSIEDSILATVDYDNFLRLYNNWTSDSRNYRKYPFYTARCTKSSTLSSINFSYNNELIAITYATKKPYQELPGSVS